MNIKKFLGLKKEFNELFKVGDIIYVEKLKDNFYSLRQLPKINGGIVVMDPYTGRVLALSGGFSFINSEFNRATQALRQPGSAFKPFIYALALENDYTPTSLVLDAPLVLDQGSDLKLVETRKLWKKILWTFNIKNWIRKIPKSYDSKNSTKFGLDKVINFSKDLGIYEDPNKLLSISLGSAETTLLKLTSAYCSFVNGGKLVEPVIIDRIQDSEGNTIINNEKRSCINCDKISFTGEEYPKIQDSYKQVFSPQTAYQITSLLEGVIQRGTEKIKKVKIKYCWKNWNH